MRPRNVGPNLKYDVELKNSINNQENNFLMIHGYNFMKLKNKNNSIKLEQDINIQRPDKNVLKIEEIIKNQKSHQKFNFRKSKGSNINKNNSINKNNEMDANNYISKYKNYQIKNDEEYQKVSNIHEDLINVILKEEDNFITEHKNHIDSMVKTIKDEMSGIHEVEKPGSNIEEYTDNLDKLLSKEIASIMNLKNRLNKFRILLKDESALANLFEDEEIIIGSNDDYNGDILERESTNI